jgi:DNA-directed RNA polymerase specialized sigma24 family protein
MNGYVEWIAAVADDVPYPKPIEPSGDQQSVRKATGAASGWRDLPAHNFPAQPAPPNEAQMQDDPLDRNPDLWMYRKRTVSLLHRYLRFSLETGRLPSFIGRECFRAKISFYTSATFEDRVIFVRDVEKSLERLAYGDQQLIARTIFQEHSQEQTARILRWGLRTVERRLPQVLDLLSEDFLRVGLLAAMPPKKGSSQ